MNDQPEASPAKLNSADVSERVSLVFTPRDLAEIKSTWKWDNLRGKILRAGLNPNRITLTSTDCSDFSSFSTVVGFGEEVLRKLSGKYGIDKWNLSPLRLEGGTLFLPTFDLGRAQREYELNLYIELTLHRAKEMTIAPPATTVENFRLNPGIEETYAILEYLEGRDEIAVDVETGYGQINTVGFAWTPQDAIAINVLPDRCADHTYFELWMRIRRVLEAPSRKILQNFIYDTSYFSAYGITTRGEIFDTMWAMKFLWPELKSNLGNVGRFYTKRPYWKDDGKVTDEEGKKKDWGNVRDWVRHYTYNCLSRDVRVHTDKGLIPIGQIARKRMRVKVKSWNKVLKRIEYKPITNWLVRPEGKHINWTCIKTAGMGKGRKGLCVTPDHKILTERGWLEASRVKEGDYLLTEGILHDDGTLLGTAWGDSSLSCTSNKSTAYLRCSQINEELIALKRNLFGGTVTSKRKSSNYGTNIFYDLYVPACPQLAELKDSSIADSIHKLTDMGIALWLMDDGCKQKNKYSPTMKLALQSYSLADRRIVHDFFKARFGSGGKLDRAGNLAFSVPQSRRICAELGYYFVPTLRYKMSHEGPDFSLEKCMHFASRRDVPIRLRVTRVEDILKNKRGYSTSYCISVKGNENFLTEYGIVANCRDTSGTLEASRNQREDIRERGLEETWKRSVLPLVEPIREMCAVGMPVDHAVRDKLKSEIKAKIESLTKTLHEVTGSEFNPKSSKQVMAYLKSHGVTIPKKFDKTKGESKESADSAALKKIRLKYPKVPGLIELAEIKKLTKALSSYVDFETRPTDGRLPYSLNGCGTETLRFSGGKDPWDRGFNIQTIPREGGTVSVKSMFVAPKGYTFIEADLKAAETWYVAYASMCKRLIEMLQSGEDVHKHVAKAILRALGKHPENDYEKKWRDLGKKTGHGSNYLMKEGTFVENVFKDMSMILSKKEGKLMLEAYFQEFPEIRKWHRWIAGELYTKRKLSAPSGWERYFYGRPGDDMLREAVAWAPQHTVPWIVNHMMFYLIEERRKQNLKFQLITQTHDALYLLVPDEWLDRVARACLRVSDWHPRVILPAGELQIPIEVEVAKCLAKKKAYEGKN